MPVVRNPMTSKRQAWIACTLSLCCAGLGHLYVGRLTRGLTFFLVSLIVIPVAALVAGMAPSTAALTLLLLAFGGLLVFWMAAVVDAGRIAARTEFAEPKEYQRPWIYTLFVIAGLCSPLLSALYVRGNLLEAYYLPTESMAPTFRRGDRILVNKTLWRRQTIDRNDMVVFRPPDQRSRNYIKRIVGLPGDQIVINGDDVQVNGRFLEIPVAPGTNNSPPPAAAEPSAAPSSPGEKPAVQTIPQGMCFVLGDNRANSRDSRAFGLVPLGDVIGVAEYIYLPGDSWSRFGRVQ